MPQHSTQNILFWRYTAETPKDFFAQNISSAQRLANGNTLINNGPNAAFFEVTPDCETVWEYAGRRRLLQHRTLTRPIIPALTDLNFPHKKYHWRVISWKTKRNIRILAILPLTLILLFTFLPLTNAAGNQPPPPNQQPGANQNQYPTGTADHRRNTARAIDLYRRTGQRD